MDYVLYGRHDGSDPAGELPPGDIAFDGTSWPRTEVIRNTLGTASFQEGLLKRETPGGPPRRLRRGRVLHGRGLAGRNVPRRRLVPARTAIPSGRTWRGTRPRPPYRPAETRAGRDRSWWRPLDGAIGQVRLSPDLGSPCRDPDLDTLDVTFFGREVETGNRRATTSRSSRCRTPRSTRQATRQIFTAQTQWVVDNILARNIAFLAHEGDIVDHRQRLLRVG